VARRYGQGQRETYRERVARRAAIDDPEVVLRSAARFLEMRSRSIDEVRRHLTTAGYRADLVDSAVARLTELGMLDDGVFARAWVQSRDRARPRGEQALRRELNLKGIDRDLIATVLAERAGEQEADEKDRGPGGTGLDADGYAEPGADLRAAEKLLARRTSTFARIADPRQRRQRAYALLARNGFDSDVCREASTRFFAPGGPGSDVSTDADGESDLSDDPP
jgi:SOS response regulatory protein OraA/RecX